MCRWAALRVAPRVFRAPEGPAAREARRPHFVRRRASKPACALRSLRRPPHQWRQVADVWRVGSLSGQAPLPLSNFARNSPVTLSNIEFRSLELQRFRTLLKLRPIELRATFLGVCPTVVVMSQAVLFWCSVGSCWFAMLRACCCGVVCGLCLVRTWACCLKEMSPRCGCVVCVVKESSPLHGDNGRILVVCGVLGR